MGRWLTVALTFLLAGCSIDLPSDVADSPIRGETARVVDVIDGDTIDVNIGGDEYRVRYIGINTPERDEICYSEAVRANRNLVDGETVTLVKDASDTDQYGRLLRYIYIGNTLINESLISDGWAEAVRFQPDTLHYDDFRALEEAAAQAGRGCHPTGIFDDGSATR